MTRWRGDRCLGCICSLNCGATITFLLTSSRGGANRSSVPLVNCVPQKGCIIETNLHLPVLLATSDDLSLQNKQLQQVQFCIAAAQQAIKAFDLPPSTKAYEDPQALADDPDIDVVICSTRVDKHLRGSLPSVKAGKRVFIEWPVGSSLAQTKEIRDKAKQKGIRSLVGLQKRHNPFVTKVRSLILILTSQPTILQVKDLVGSGKIGRVNRNTNSLLHHPERSRVLAPLSAP